MRYTATNGTIREEVEEEFQLFCEVILTQQGRVRFLNFVKYIFNSPTLC